MEMEHGLFPENPHYLVMEILEEGEDTGVCNHGFHPGIFYEREHVITSPVMPERSGETVIG